MPADTLPGARLFSAAAERNRDPMRQVLGRVLPAHGRALEIASGSGQHVAWFARHLPGWTWQPTDCTEENLASIAAWCDGSGGEAALANVLAPLRLDVLQSPWPVGDDRFDAVLCTNMLHIAPWAACGALMRGAARHLADDGVLVTYGPYLEDDVPTAPSNLEFDAWLRRRDPASGLRRREDVAAAAGAAGLRLRERVALPANNLMLVFERARP
jgi:hypothetical protein